MIRVLLGIDLKADTVIVNYDGTRVWLKESFSTGGSGMVMRSRRAPKRAAYNTVTMGADKPDFGSRLGAAVGGLDIAELRVRTGVIVGSGFQHAGKALSAYPKPDPRADSDVYAFGILLGMAGQLLHSAALLLPADLAYASAALGRQLVEIEYLTWAFKEGDRDAARWLQSTHQERQKIFSPANLRRTSKGRFLDIDYRHHCEQGGHPIPLGAHLLVSSGSSQILMADLLCHAWRTWDQTIAWAAGKSAVPTILEPFAGNVYAALQQWGCRDKIYALMVETAPNPDGLKPTLRQPDVSDNL